MKNSEHAETAALRLSAATQPDDFDLLGFDDGSPTAVPALKDSPATPYQGEDLEFSFKNSISTYSVEGLRKKTSSKSTKGISKSAEMKLSGGTQKQVSPKKTLHAKIQQDLAGKTYRESQEVLLRYVKYFFGEETIQWPAMQRVISACGKDFAEVIKLVVQVSLTDTDNPQGLMVAWSRKRQQSKSAVTGEVWDSQPLRGE
jgi:hypothetical protein